MMQIIRRTFVPMSIMMRWKICHVHHLTLAATAADIYCLLHSSFSISLERNAIGFIFHFMETIPLLGCLESKSHIFLQHNKCDVIEKFGLMVAECRVLNFHPFCMWSQFPLFALMACHDTNRMLISE